MTSGAARIAPGLQAPAVRAIGGLLALLTVLGAAGLLWHARQSDIDQWRQTAAILSTTMTEHAEQTVRAADLVLQTIVIPLNEARIASEEDLWRTMDTPAIHEAIRNKVAAVPQVDVASIVDRHGDIINFNRYYPPDAPGTPGKRLNLADRDYVQAMMKRPDDQPFISAPVQNRVTGQWTFYLARQIRDRAGEPIGMVITGINSSFFEAFFRAVNIGKGSAIALYRGDGVMLARDPPAGAFIGRSFANQPLFRQVLKPGAAANAQVATDPPLVGRQGELRIVAPLRLRDFPLVTNVTLSEDIVLANWRVTARLVGVLAVVLAATALALSGLLARLPGRRHRTLADPARANAAAEAANVAKPVTAAAMCSAIAPARRNLAGQQDDAAAGRGGARLAGLGVLVVDDSETNREVARHILENNGAKVLLAADGGQAVDMLRATPLSVHIVLMDVQMPVLDGYQATRQIRETLRLADLPVVALTAGAFTNQQAAAFAAGMNGFISKPFDVDDLIATVLRLTGGRPATAAPAADRAPAASPIDLQRGLSNWGDRASFRTYLRRFAATHGRDGQDIAGLLAQGRREDAAALTHKLKGAAGSMALMNVWHQADSLEQTIHQRNDTAALVHDLQAALEAACSAIAAYTAAEGDAPKPAIADATGVSQLLDALLLVLDQDDPEAAEPILDRLAGQLPAARLAALRERLEVFDFRGAEAITHALRARPRIGADQAVDEMT